MKKNYQTKTAAAMTLPDSVAIAMTDLADELREGLLALAVGTGLQVMGVLMGIDITGEKHPLSITEGDTENATVVKDLLVGREVDEQERKVVTELVAGAALLE